MVEEKVTQQSVVNGSFEPLFCANSLSALFKEGVCRYLLEVVGKLDVDEGEKQVGC